MLIPVCSPSCLTRTHPALFLTFLPTPLVLLTDSNGQQAVHIAPEAFDVTTAAFGSEISFWQDALPGALKGNLKLVSLEIDFFDLRLG